MNSLKWSQFPTSESEVEKTLLRTKDLFLIDKGSIKNKSEETGDNIVVTRIGKYSLELISIPGTDFLVLISISTYNENTERYDFHYEIPQGYKKCQGVNFLHPDL